ncbi:uncharacterized protein LOC131981368 [Centropristis striata]|uniref:uncharacterized protein LOC131981368 n=1 Tax=Centropristis striata TaxID=184440 RepID=UPI0027DED37D|nr:uncharacterized protein LOC131981368 [Centropristis striata]
MSDSEDLELEEELQGANKLLQDLEKKRAFRSRDSAELKRVQRELKRSIRESKDKYRRKLEHKLEDNNTRDVWSGMREITGFQRRGGGAAVEGNVERANELNLFFNRFNSNHPTPGSPSTDSLNNNLPPPPITSCPTPLPRTSSHSPPPPPAADTSLHHHHQHPPTPQSGLHITSSQVRRELERLKQRKAAGPDRISPHVLKACSSQLCGVLQHLFNLSLHLQIVPVLWKTSCLVPVPKKGRPASLEDYRPVALTSHIMKNKAQAEPEPDPRPVHWKKRDRRGDVIPQRPSSSRHTSGVPHVSTDQHQCPGEGPSYDVASVNPTRVPETEVLRQELLQLLEDEAVTCQTSSELAATDWEIRNTVSWQKWKEARPSLIENMLATLDPHPHRVCQCGKQVIVRCLDCLPLPFLCEDCDIAVHTRFVPHNREAVTGGFLQPSSGFQQQTVRLLPVQRPDHLCGCSAGNIDVSPGRILALVTINGRYDLALPVVKCTSCGVMWSPSIKDIQASGYWPGTLNFCTLFSTDVFQSFYDIKKAAPGMSLKAFVKMLDERTAHFGRTGKISADTFSKSFLEWSAVKFEVDRMCKETCFSCPACTPDMLAVSVDGNRKLYRFKSNASTSEQGNFEGTFIQKDEEVAEFVKYIQRRTNHVAQQCPEMRNLLSMRPFLSVMHAKAHTWKCEIKWGGAFQDGAGSTVGEEVEQVNSFLSRAAITTKYMSKAGRTDMLTLLALGWNKRKVEQLGRTLSQRYLKITRILREQVESLNATKNELGVDDDTLQQWVADVQQWAEETDQTDGSLGALQARIEELVIIIRVRTQNLYRQTDSNKRRHRIRKVILDEKK